MSPADPSVPPKRSPLAERYLPLVEAERAEEDWYRFVLEELNGFGTLLRFQIEEQGSDSPALAKTKDRIGAVLDTLSWNAAVALKQTWAFADKRVQDFDDAWGPHLVLAALEPNQDHVREWLTRLPAEARALIDDSPLA